MKQKKYLKKFMFNIQMKSVKVSDKKLRIMTQELIGKKIIDTSLFLSVQKTPISKIFFKLIKSAIANALNKEINIYNIFIKNIYVNKGKFHKKIFTRSQGRVNYIKKKTSHIHIFFDTIE
jgi:large subunit ribosomal protein L22